MEYHRAHLPQWKNLKAIKSKLEVPVDSYFDVEELKKIGLKTYGTNVKISRKASIYGAQHISIGNNVQIDDYACLVANSSEIILGSNIHVGFFSILMGSGGIVMEDFSAISSRVSLYTASDDFWGEALTNSTIPLKYRKLKMGKIILKRHVLIGTNSTVLPGITIGEGSSVGAHSLVIKTLDSWGVYSGSPAIKIRNRSKKILELERDYLLEYSVK